MVDGSLWMQEERATVSPPNPAPLFEGSEWDFDTLRRTYDAVEQIAFEDLGLDVYPNQIEIISTEQMIDAETLEFGEVVAEGARLGRATPRPGNHIPAIRVLDAGLSRPGIGVDNEPTA